MEAKQSAEDEAAVSSADKRFLQSSVFQTTSSREPLDKPGTSSSEDPDVVNASENQSSLDEGEEKWRQDIVDFQKLVMTGPYHETYQVRHRETGELAFLKASRKHYQYKSKYLSEEYIWKMASPHPHIVKMYASYSIDDSKFYFFEYLSEGTLRNFMKVHKVLRTGVAQLLSAQIMSAVEYLHSKGIFHREISNRYILLSAGGQAKLSQFRHSLINKTARGVHRDLYYQAPEVFSGKIYDQTADWYSLGVCMYEMVVGMTPVEYHCMRNKIQFKTLDWNGKIVVMLTCFVYIPKMFPKNLKNILEGLLQENKEQRLGYKEHVETIKDHPFFCQVNWKAIESGLSKVNMSSFEINSKMLN